jgi:myo-inositol-1(or 4)-monophosphatase
MMQRELEMLQDTVRRAGQRVLQLAQDGFDTHIKQDRSPVTSADLEVGRLLRQDLLGAFPDDGWLSEEDPDDPQRLDKKRIWVVDPIDGTKYFMKGVPQYTISVALVKASRPVTAVVYNPATKQLFSAVRSSGAWLNGHRIRVRNPHTRPSILVSPPAWERGRFRTLEAAAECRPIGSIAYTLALIAAGQADGTLNMDRLNEWDVAAGVLLVEEAGGIALDSKGNQLRFNQPQTAIQGIIAAPIGLKDRMETFAKALWF